MVCSQKFTVCLAGAQTEVRDYSLPLTKIWGPLYIGNPSSNLCLTYSACKDSKA